MSFDLLRRFRSLATLGVLCVLLLVGVSWGWSSVTEPLPKTEDPPICVDTIVAAGDKVYPDQITVSVLNGGSREGLAGQTMDALVGQGFLEGQLANAPAKANVTDAEIWTDDPQSAAVLLVATYLAKNGKGVVIREEETTALGVNVVVGDEFQAVIKGNKSVTADTDTTICSPPQ